MRWADRYRAFVRGHVGYVGAAEVVLPWLTWLVPDRFSTTELPAELINSLSGIITILHDGILDSDAAKGPALSLALLQQLEVLIEMTAIRLEHTGILRSKYTILVLLEAAKLIMRAQRIRQGGVLLDGGLAQHLDVKTNLNDRLTAALQGMLANAKPPVTDSTAVHSSGVALLGPGDRCNSDSLWWLEQGCNSADSPQAGLNNRRPGRQHISPTVGSETCLTPLPSACARMQRGAGHASCKPCGFQEQGDCRSRLRWMLAFGEGVAAARPFVYVVLLRRWGRRSWVPWFATLCVELSGHLASRRALQLLNDQAVAVAEDGELSNTSGALLRFLLGWQLREQDVAELRRRRWLLLWWLLRDPFYCSILSPRLRNAQRAAGSLPLLGAITRYALNMLEGVQQYYVYTSAS